MKQRAASEVMAERYERFVELRDADMRLVDVTRELGVSEATAYKYDRAYRQLRGIPAKSTAPWSGPT